MLLTVTLNPAIDKRYVLESLRPGQVLRVRECAAVAGGKGLNVTRAAHIAGEDVLATGILGGFAGQYIEAALRAEGIASAFFHAALETRTCINVYDEAAGQQTEFLEPGEPVSAADLARFEDEFAVLAARADVITISGSLPKGAPTDTYARLIGAAKALGKPVLLDSSGAALREGLRAGPALIKPNSDEIAQLTDETDLPRAARALLAQGPGMVVISLGGEGALLAAPAGVWRGRPPEITAVNTVGCGDGMLAAFAMAIAREEPPETALRRALALSCASAMHPGTGTFDPADMAWAYGRCTIEKLA